MRFCGSSKLDEIGWCWMHIQAWIWWQGILLQSQFSLFLCILKPEAYAQKLDRSKTPAKLHIMNWHPDSKVVFVWQGQYFCIFCDVFRSVAVSFRGRRSTLDVTCPSPFFLWQCRVFCESHCQGCVKWRQGASSVASVAFCETWWKLTRNIDFEVANLKVHKKTRRKHRFWRYKLEEVSHEMLVLMLPRVSSRVFAFPVASPCLWGKLQNLSFSKVSKQFVMLFCVAGAALCDIPTCLITWHSTL